MQQTVVGIIGAMEVEVDLLRSQLRDRTSIEKAGMTFDQGFVGETSVVLTRCGIGKVSAAMGVQAMVDLFGVTHVVNTGIAGSLDESIEIGDLVVSTDVIHHDMDVTALGYAPGQVPGLAASFVADENLAGRIAQAAALAVPDATVCRGRVASGDQFVADQTTKQRIVEMFGARCCEMEGAAIAQACQLNGVPFAIVRAISDKANGSSVEDYPAFEERTAHRCAAIVGRMLKDWE